MQLEGLLPCRGGRRSDERSWGHFMGDFILHTGWLDGRRHSNALFYEEALALASTLKEEM